MMYSRLRHKPIQYILGDTYFMGNRILVKQPVLIPRVETEKLCELILEDMKNKQPFKFLEIGCGSGCISISLCKNSNCEGVAIDISQHAVSLTKKNAKLVLGKKWYKKLSVYESDMWKFSPGNKFDLIVSNPPYIPSLMINGLEKQVKLWEDNRALDGGDDGFKYVEFIIKQDWVKENGEMWFEIDSSHKDKVEGEYIEDIFGRCRYLKIKK
ncbi:PRMC [Blepharisma stoltei]|uniref:peptide chain release factor N(5)-glutamine methyltransferase n=1 Tax=Blepharisma stoltei TaxID=1481888 RepID=A0AAU9INA1_9CILI|nr:unnamed protein product [Blepharisma stoltei]